MHATTSWTSFVFGVDCTSYSGVILKCLSSHICDDGMIVLLLFPRGFKCKLRVSFFFFANDKKRMLDAQGRMDPFF